MFAICEAAVGGEGAGRVANGALNPNIAPASRKLVAYGILPLATLVLPLYIGAGQVRLDAALEGKS
jgi:hypothetical protein